MPKVTKDKKAMIKRGNILYNLRMSHGKNQTVIAEYLGISQQAYLKYEHGDSDPTIDALIKLSDFYKTSIDYLLGLSDTQATYQKEDLKAACLSLPRKERLHLVKAILDDIIKDEEK